MTPSHETTQLLDEIEKHAHGKLLRRKEVGLLIELARDHDQWQTLDELSFFAKFSHKSHGILKRIGKDAEGFDKLTHEFTESVKKCAVLMKILLERAEDAETGEFETTFLTMTPATFQNLLSLLRDLSWYKNYTLDLRNRAPL